MKAWHDCPRCRLSLGSPVVGDDHHRICLFCGKAWTDRTPTTMDDSRRVPRAIADTLARGTR